MSFLKDNFGTDLLISSWLFLVSNIFYCLACFLTYFDKFRTVNSTIISDSYAYDTCMLISSLIYLESSYRLLVLTYPENFLVIIESSRIKDQNIDFFEKYFGYKSFFRPFSLIFLGTAVMLIYPIYAVFFGYLSTSFFIQFTSFILLVMLFIYGWILSFWYQFNSEDGQGTRVLYNILSTCCFRQSYWDEIFIRHCYPDSLGCTWIFTILSALIFVACGYVLIIRSNSVLVILGFLSCLFLSLGSFYMVYTTYPENIMASTVYDNILIHFDKTIGTTDKNNTSKSDYNSIEMTEPRLDPQDVNQYQSNKQPKKFICKRFSLCGI